ncbi:hypothetical protein DPMN_034022, partial [Dreissena polymorpha]
LNHCFRDFDFSDRIIFIGTRRAKTSDVIVCESIQSYGRADNIEQCAGVSEEHPWAKTTSLRNTTIESAA